MVTDSLEGRIYLTPEWQTSLRQLVCKVQSDSRASLALLSMLLGKMVSAIHVILWARLHARDLQWFILPFQKLGKGSSATRVQVPPPLSAGPSPGGDLQPYPRGRSSMSLNIWC